MAYVSWNKYHETPNEITIQQHIKSGGSLYV